MIRPLILPPLRRTTADVEIFARIVHAGQTDKAGRSHIEHLERVASRTMAKVAGLPGILDPAAVSEMLQIAWLHDSLEPDRRPYGTIVAEDLLSEGFSQVVVQGVVLLTPTPGVSHLAGIEHIISFGGLPTILVKLSDNEDNADPEWLATLPEDVQARLLAKYKPSMVMLRDAAPAKEWRG